jgi:beta-fructofuranosidase
MKDHSGRTLMFAWSWEARSRAAQAEAGWAGVLTVPRVVTIGKSGRPEQHPAPELEQLRTEQHQLTNLEIPADEVVPTGIRGASLDIEVTLNGGTARQVGLRLLASNDGAEFTALTWDRFRSILILNRERASLDSSSYGDAFVLELEPPDEPDECTLRILIDASILEVFTEDGRSITARVYPSLASSLGVNAFAYGGAGSVARIAAWAVGQAIAR